MSRSAQIAEAEANLALLRGNVWGVLAQADLSAGGALAPTFVFPMEVNAEGNYTGDIIIERNGVSYRVTVDYL